MNYGNSLFELEDLSEARYAFMKLIEIAPKWSEGYYSLAKVYAKENVFDNAVNYLAGAILLDPSKEKQFKKDFPTIVSNQDISPYVKALESLRQRLKKR